MDEPYHYIPEKKDVSFDEGEVFYHFMQTFASPNLLSTTEQATQTNATEFNESRASIFQVYDDAMETLEPEAKHFKPYLQCILDFHKSIKNTQDCPICIAASTEDNSDDFVQCTDTLGVNNDGSSEPTIVKHISMPNVSKGQVQEKICDEANSSTSVNAVANDFVVLNSGQDQNKMCDEKNSSSIESNSPREIMTDLPITSSGQEQERAGVEIKASTLPTISNANDMLISNSLQGLENTCNKRDASILTSNFNTNDFHITNSDQELEKMSIEENLLTFGINSLTGEANLRKETEKTNNEADALPLAANSVANDSPSQNPVQEQEKMCVEEDAYKSARNSLIDDINLDKTCDKTDESLLAPNSNTNDLSNTNFGQEQEKICVEEDELSTLATGCVNGIAKDPILSSTSHEEVVSKMTTFYDVTETQLKQHAKSLAEYHQYLNTVHNFEKSLFSVKFK